MVVPIDCREVRWSLAALYMTLEALSMMLQQAEAKTRDLLRAFAR